jgi:hypothetical protein
MYEAQCLPVAPTFTRFLARLGRRPTMSEPE